MGYSPPNTFIDGTIINATKIKENLVAAGVYINSGIAGSDIGTEAVKTKHIVRPSFFQTTGSCGGANFETGSIISYKGPPLDADMSTYILNAPLTYNGFIAGPMQPETSASNWRTINKTGLSFYVDTISAVHIEYSGEFVTPDCHTGSPPIVNKAAIAVDGTVNVSSVIYWNECDDGTLYETDNMRRIFQTHVHINLLQGWHHVAIYTGLNSNIAFIGAINALVEVVNIVNV